MTALFLVVTQGQLAPQTNGSAIDFQFTYNQIQIFLDSKIVMQQFQIVISFDYMVSSFQVISVF